MSTTATPTRSEWARVAVITATLANLLVLAFVSLPVIGFFLMTFNGMSSEAPLSLGGKLIWLTIMLLAAALPIGSIYFAWRLLRRGQTGRAIAAAFAVPILGALLYGAYGPGGWAYGSAPGSGSGTSQLHMGRSVG